MSLPEREGKVRDLAHTIERELFLIYGVEMGFFLNTSPCGGSGGIADYISNCERESGIAWMKETIERLENNEEIPAVVDGAH